MVRKSLVVFALMAMAAPAAAQEEYVWTSKRPDAPAPAGVSWDRVLDKGALEVSYRFSTTHSNGVYFGGSLWSPEKLTDQFGYPVIPLSLVDLTQTAYGAFGLLDDLTLTGSIGVTRRTREQITTSYFYTTMTQQVGDLDVAALYRFFNQGPIQAHLQGGVRVPVGRIYQLSPTPFAALEFVPYDMRIGGGTFAALPGMTILVQNEHGSVGAQIRGEINFGTNARGFRRGSRLDLSGWAAYQVSEYFSVSARLKWERWGGISGQDPALNPTRDPGHEAYFSSGTVVYIPMGVNFYLPDDHKFGGQRLTLEALTPISRDYDSPWLGVDWGLVVGWSMSVF
ncbi:MAG: hypothetical protein OEZ65_13685 [Gemmatimonadota bacterium]|nr:hypothetical protein [Gemmatimonadota bacterium]MDH5760634.1 hypothetical protein [Gemmatimonadota bacterium]